MSQWGTSLWLCFLIFFCNAKRSRLPQSILRCSLCTSLEASVSPMIAINDEGGEGLCASKVFDSRTSHFVSKKPHSSCKSPFRLPRATLMPAQNGKWDQKMKSAAITIEKIHNIIHIYPGSPWTLQSISSLHYNISRISLTLTHVFFLSRNKNYKLSRTKDRCIISISVSNCYQSKRAFRSVKLEGFTATRKLR